MSARRSLAKQPPAPPPTKPASGLAPGQAVIVTSGMSKGVRGVLVASWGEYEKGIPSWCVDLPDARRVIREDFLERVPA